MSFVRINPPPDQDQDQVHEQSGSGDGGAWDAALPRPGAPNGPASRGRMDMDMEEALLGRMEAGLRGGGPATSRAGVM